MRRFGLVLRGEGEFILRIAGDLPLVGDVFGGLAHVIAVERIPQAVADHRVDIFHIAHLVPGAQMRGMGAERHVFLTARRDDVGIAKLDMLRAQRHGAQARAADLVDAPGRAFDGQARIDMRLARGVLALCGGQNLTKDGFGHLGLLDARPRDDGFEHGSPQIMGGRIGERARERADSGARGRCDYDVGHGILHHLFGGGAVSAAQWIR